MDKKKEGNFVDPSGTFDSFECINMLLVWLNGGERKKKSAQEVRIIPPFSHTSCDTFFRSFFFFFFFFWTFSLFVLIRVYIVNRLY